MPAQLNQDPRPDLDGIRRRFININRERLRLTCELLDDRQHSFVDALPLLFHGNNEGLPGYISDDTPAGIFDYSLSNKDIKAVEGLFRGCQVNRRARHKMEIYGMYFMGSSGSIAFNRHSDFDVWLLHDASLAPERIDLLQRKAHEIEKWAEQQLRLEVHFFIFSAEEFKNGKQQGLSSESSGSAQHYLLLDEFYRSSLLIAGRIPAWWLVPPEQEANYDEYLDSMRAQGFLDDDDFLDFGSVADIPAAEFFGAAVWQLYKSINSPYKSLMKLLLMEVYASEFPQISVLSMMFKEAVYNGNNNIDELDPYVMMYDRIEEYLMIHNQRERLELFRQCFYIKINEPLGNEIRRRSWRRDLFKQMALEWGWTQEQFLVMDKRKQWQIGQIATQRNRLMNALTESYRFLSAFARQNTEVSLVSQTELNILGRKLYAAFERKTGKIDIINRDNDSILNASTVNIQQHRGQSGQETWQLHQYLRQEDEHNEQSKPVKRAKSLIELAAWAYFNRIIDSHSAFTLNCQDDLTVKELRQILSALEEEFPERKLHNADFNDLNQPARIEHACLFVNTGKIPQVAGSDHVGHVSSLRDNILSYGGKRDNLVISVDLLISTTWEELLTFHFEGPESLPECLCEFTHWYPISGNCRPPKFHVYSFSSSYAPAITRRIDELFQELVNHFYHRDVPELQRYILEIGDNYHQLCNSSGHFAHEYIGNSNKLFRNLATPNASFSPLLFDKQTRSNMLLQTIFKLNRENRIQLFFSAKNNSANIYIIDENGSLFTQTVPYFDGKALIKHYDLFFRSTINRRLFLMLENSSDIENIEIEFYSINEATDRPFRLTRINNDIDDSYSNFFNIQVIGGADDRHNSLCIFCQDAEFSLMEHGNQLFTRVAEYIMQLRSSGEQYPIYITDVDISHTMMEQLDSGGPQTIHYLNYKKRIEDSLNKAIAMQ